MTIVLPHDAYIAALILIGLCAVSTKIISYICLSAAIEGDSPIVSLTSSTDCKKLAKKGFWMFYASLIPSTLLLIVGCWDERMWGLMIAGFLLLVLGSIAHFACALDWNNRKDHNPFFKESPTTSEPTPC